MAPASNPRHPREDPDPRPPRRHPALPHLLRILPPSPPPTSQRVSFAASEGWCHQGEHGGHAGAGQAMAAAEGSVARGAGGVDEPPDRGDDEEADGGPAE